jgi:hypothetical protein
MDEEKNAQAQQEQNENAAEDSVRLFDTDDEPVVTSEDKGEDVVEKSEDSNEDIKASIEGLKREQRISDFLNNPDNADYREFADKIKEVASKPEAKGLTMNAIANMVIPKDYWIKKGAEISAQANQESQESYTGGSSTRKPTGSEDSSGLPDPSSLSKEEFEKKAWDIARGV